MKKNKLVLKPVEFKLAAPPGSRVFVAGTFNGWNSQQHQLEDAKGTGTYAKHLSLPMGRHEYRFVVEGSWQSDPANPHSVPNALGTTNNVLEVR